jgi:hypothetical protein
VPAQRLTAALAVAAAATFAMLAAPVPAAADSASVPGVVSTTAVNTSSLPVHVPKGVRPTAISMVLTQPEIVNGGLVAIAINGRVVRTIPSTLYQKVTIPVRGTDVAADGTIGLAVRSTGPPIDKVCRPDIGTAVLRKVTLRYQGTETPPTTLAQFFPPTTSRFDVVVDAEADVAVQQAALVTVAALSSRYPSGTDIRLTSADELPRRGVASQRAIALTVGRPAEVLTQVSTGANGVPTLTITATGDELAAAARALALAKAGDPLLNNPTLSELTAEIGSRTPKPDLTLGDVTDQPVSLAGFGVLAHTVRVPQDAFASRVATLAVHLEGTTSAITETDRARVDVRMNGDLVGSQSLRPDGRLAIDFTVPAGGLRAVNELQIQLSAVTTQGAPCAGLGVAPVEVDLDLVRSTLTATLGAGGGRGFQQLPQVLSGSLPVAIRGRAEGRTSLESLRHAAGLVAALQQAAAEPLNVQLIPADAFLAGDRSGIFVGATTDDAAALRAPLKLSSLRVLDRADATFQITSQEPYAALEAFTSDGRDVLMLGAWAPSGSEADPRLSRSIVQFANKQGWASLDGDLVLTDGASDPFVVDSQVLLPPSEPLRPEGPEENSYAKWFIAGAGVLLVIGALQVALVIRRDRRAAHSIEDYLDPDRSDDLDVLPD